MFNSLLDPLASLLYPRSCTCGHLIENLSDGAACSGCWKTTKLFERTDELCDKCGAFLVDRAVSAPGKCGHCDDHRYDTARSAGQYHAALKASVLHLKREPEVSRRVKECLMNALRQMDLPDEYLVVPVPLSKKRQLERGFNQAYLLASYVSKYSGRRLDELTLIRQHDTPMHRAAMDRKAREVTVLDAFAVVRPGLIKEKNILLVDDLMTSGSTASQCAKVLKRNGAANVFVLTLAHAVHY